MFSLHIIVFCSEVSFPVIIQVSKSYSAFRLILEYLEIHFNFKVRKFKIIYIYIYLFYQDTFLFISEIQHTF